ncbi:hypothetical protein NSK_005339 [Nannochloropsis salina CCMP1776]|uniref:Uncharacterized protein n=1 Tax=Nannochloropsis salina CCMP1776 TaxID=1027361 RepID=A0A4D9D4A4_9STRA|nr:hypothetical protein NSK_005339 [Nannochloropsis salina CCMP1776]|eukprot:TFJ83369.1 hypothetical protein NSK_005339 [Nannochloropsis salina CCMP1776]
MVLASVAGIAVVGVLCVCLPCIIIIKQASSCPPYPSGEELGKKWATIFQGIGAVLGVAGATAVVVRSKEVVDDLIFKLLLPAALVLVRSSTRPKHCIYPEVVKNPDESTAVFWLGFDFVKAKGGKRVFKAKLKVDECAPETLTVTGLAYLVNATDLTTYCATPLASPAVLNVRYSKAKKAATCAPTPAPTVNPTQPFVLFGEGQRCLEAGRLAPFDRRRLSSSLRVERGDTDSTHAEHRQLQSIATPSDCYTYCSLNGGERSNGGSHAGPFGSPYCIAYSCPYGFADRVAYCIAYSCPYGFADRVAYCIAYSCSYGITYSVAYSCPYGFAYSVAYCIAYSCSYGITYSCPYGFAYSIAYCIAYSCSYGIAYSIAYCMAYS